MSHTFKWEDEKGNIWRVHHNPDLSGDCIFQADHGIAGFGISVAIPGKLLLDFLGAKVVNRFIYAIETMEIDWSKDF